MSLPALYELASQYKEALAVLDDSDFPDDFVQETLDGLQGTLEQKAVNVAAFARNLEALAEQIRGAEVAMAGRRRALEARAARLRGYLHANLERAGILKVEHPYFVLTVKRNPPSVIVTDVDALPDEYCVPPAPPERVADKRKIGDAIKAGNDVPGAHLETKTRLEIK